MALLWGPIKLGGYGSYGFGTKIETPARERIKMPFGGRTVKFYFWNYWFTTFQPGLSSGQAGHTHFENFGPRHGFESLNCHRFWQIGGECVYKISNCWGSSGNRFYSRWIAFYCCALRRPCWCLKSLCFLCFRWNVNRLITLPFLKTRLLSSDYY